MANEVLYQKDNRITRHSPEGVAFKKRCEEVGFQKAVAEKDSGEMI